MATKKTNTVYKEPVEFIPKDLQKKYGIGAYASTPKKKTTTKKK